MALVLHHSQAKGGTKLVLVGIANHDGDGGAYPKVETLARYAGMNVRNTQRAIRRLVEMGEVVVHLQDGGRRKMPDHLRPNRYEVLVSCPTWCDRTGEHRDTRPKASRQQHLTTEADTTEADPDDLSRVLHTGVAGDTPSPQVGGVARDTPPGGASDTPEPSSRTNPPTPPHDPRPCADCGQDQARCQRAQAHWPPGDRHDYRPASTLAAVAHTPPAPPPPRRTRASG